MVIKLMTAVAEPKDLYVQFSATATVFNELVTMGMKALVEVLPMTIPGVVAMMDGLKQETLAPAIPSEQNRDYNSWTGNTNRIILLVWDQFGKIVGIS